MKKKKLSEAKQKELIKSLTWDKFWKYKLCEILGVVGFVFIPF